MSQSISTAPSSIDHIVIYFAHIRAAIEPPVPAGAQARARIAARAVAQPRGRAGAGGGRARPGATTAQLARACDLPVATAARLLATLSDEGFAERTRRRRRLDARAAARPPRPRRGPRPRPARRERPGARGGRRARGRERRARRAPAGAGDGRHRPGRRPRAARRQRLGRPGVPLHASGPGKLVLAELDDDALADWVARVRPERLTPRTITSLRGLRAELDAIRRQGWAELDDELEPELASLAVTVRGARGTALAFIGVSGPTGRLDARRRRALVRPLQAAADQLARAVAGGR